MLEKISLKVNQQQSVAVVGESGSGKSTLARVITDLLPIIFDNWELPSELYQRQKSDLRCLQMIYQMPDTALNPRHSVGMTIGRPLEFYFEMSSKVKKTIFLSFLI